MTPKDDHFDEFGDHTLVKHFLLDAYLKRWASILTKRFPEVWFVDAFAGAGGDRQGHDGSPLIAARIAREINRGLYPSGLPPKGGMRIVCYEKDETIYARLIIAITEIQVDPHVFILTKNNTLEDRVVPVVKHLEKKPTLFFLDPFGVDGLSAAVIAELLKGSHHELLVLFADEAAVRLAGKAHAGVQDAAMLEADAVAAERENGDLFGDAGLAMREEDARTKARRSASGHKSNPNAKVIMDRAYGGNWWQPILRATPESERQPKAAELYEQRVLRQQGAAYVLRFSVRTKDHDRHKYFLFHASKNSQAHVAMKHAMHATRKHAAEPGAMFQVFEPSVPLPAVADQIASAFAGRTSVRWQDQDDPTNYVRAYAEHETPVWLHEIQDLKAILIERYADRKPNGAPANPLTLTFPAR